LLPLTTAYMNQYMVEITLPERFTREFVRLIPDQRAQVNRLFEEGSIRSYSLSLDRAQLWAVMIAPSVQDIEEILGTFPIMPYCSFSIHELMFHDMATQELPRISLN
jgi:muconolactone delta-isomerase